VPAAPACRSVLLPRSPRGRRRTSSAAVLWGAIGVAAGWGPGVSSASEPPASSRATSPHVVVVITDDQGYGDFGATGNPLIDTPAIDALAAQSASLATFYVSPVCSPTRASLMTGRWNYRTRVVDTYLGRSMMEPAEETLAEALRAVGYRTGAFGKWHLGDCYPMRPMDQGFDESLVHRGGGLAQPSEPLENAGRYTDPILLHNGRETPTRGFCTDVYFDAAFRFMAESVAQGKPFFAYIAVNAPHGPFHDVPADQLAKYRQRDLTPLIVEDPRHTAGPEEADRLARVAAMIGNIDQNIGRLVERLDALGLTRETLVVFLNDNGPNTRRYVGPFRGMKTEVYEGGVRSPCWLRWPARFAPGTRVAAPAAHVDLMPTILAACGAESAGAACDGMNLLPLLQQPDRPWPQRPIFLQAHRGDVPLRGHHVGVRLGPWKLLRNSGFEQERLREGIPWELYRVAEDPGETRDLAAAHPEIVARLEAAYDAWFDDVSQTRPDNYAPPRIVVDPAVVGPTTLTWQDWRGDDWEDGGYGTWLLEIRAPGPHAARLRWRNPPDASRVVVQVNDRELAYALPPGASDWQLVDVPLPAGAVRLAAYAVGPAGPQGAYQAVIDRNPGAAPASE